MRFQSLVTGFSLLLGVPLGAQERTSGSDSTARLQRVTVTATRSRITTLQAPLAVTVLDRTDLRHRRGYGLDEVLNLVPGVVAQSRSGNQDVRIIIRGFGARGAGDRSNAGTSRGIRVLLDGIPETEPDGRTSFDNIDLASAEQIDVVRSNASSVWGNAAGGVVNVSTRPEFSNSMFEVGQTGGSFGLQRTTLRGGASLGAGHVAGSLVNSTFDGWRQGSDSRRVLGNVSWFGTFDDRTQVSMLGVYANNYFGIPGPLTQANVDLDPSMANATYLLRRERRYNRTGRLGMTLTHDLNAANRISALAYVNPKYLQRSERGTFRDFTRYHVGSNLVYSNTVSRGERSSHLQVGADQAYQDGAILFYGLTPAGNRATDVRDNKREGASNFGVFVQEEVGLGRATFTAGARYDRIHYIARSFINPKLNAQKDFTRVTPKLGVSWRVSPTQTFYANVGGGVEAPAGNETDPASTFGQDTISAINPLLDPIRSTTFEVGTKHLLVSGTGALRDLSYDVALYQTSVTNEIVPYRGGRFYFSAGEARRRGAELGLSARLQGGLSLQGALTLSDNKYVDYRVDSVHYNIARAGQFADYSGNKIVGVPGSMSTISATWQPAALRGFGVNYTLQRMGDYWADDANKVKVPSFVLSNVTFSYDQPVLARGGVGIRTFLTVNNLADRSYIGSAFLNPDIVNNVPVAYEPGLPRNIVLSFSVERLR